MDYNLWVNQLECCSSFALRHVNSLQQHVNNLEKDYDNLNDEVAKGENSSYDEASSPKYLTL